MRGKIAVVVSFVLLFAGVLAADEVLLGQIYGTGVHAFNEGDYVGAYNALTSAIKGGSNDPRAYYFRGLAYLKLGRDDEAKADFSKGAELEVADSVNEFPVNRSLERIQGRPRQLLEYYRMTVHAVAVQRQEAARQARYEQRAAAEQDVLRRVAPAQLPAIPAAPVPSIPPQSEKAANPFEPGAEPAPAAKPAMEAEKNNPFEPQKPAEKPAAEAPDTTPFGNPTPPATKAGADDPFTTPPTTAPKATPKPEPAEGGDPFGNPVPAPATEKPAANQSSSNAVDNSKPVEPTNGGIGSLFHAFVAGSETNAPPAAAGAPPMGFEDFVKGFMGGAAVPPAVGQEGAVPAPGGGQPAMTQPAQPAAAQPAADDPFGPAAAPTAPAPAGRVPAPNGNAPAPMPANQVPPPATQVPPPAADGDPFK
jgi:hypothetical protein